jgi:hypothetical protein
MGKGLEVVTSFATAPGVAAFAACAAATGNSLQVRSADVKSKVWLLEAWAFNQVAGQLRIRSPRLHDAVNGIRYRIAAASVLPRFGSCIAGAFGQFLIPQDTLIVESQGSAVGGQIESNTLLVYYENLPGVAARLIHNATLQQYGVNRTTIQATITAVATGQYGGGVLVNAATQNLKANTDYALLGGESDTRGTVIRATGVDFGSLGVGFPAEPSIADVTESFFQNIAINSGMPTIPVFNSANFGGITVDVQTNQAGGTYIADLNLVELQGGTVPAAGSGPSA